MRKAILTIAVLTAAMLLLCGTVMAEGQISEETISHLSGISGMDGDSVRSILENAGMTEDLLAQMSEDEILEGLRQNTSHGPVRDYSYLFSRESVNQTLEGRELLRVAVYSSDDAVSPSLMIDYEEGKIYYSGGIRFFDNLDQAEHVSDLDEDTAAAVKNIVREILERGYSDLSSALKALGNTLAGLAVETDLGVTNFVIENADAGSGTEVSNYVSQIFRIYYDKSGN